MNAEARARHIAALAGIVGPGGVVAGAEAERYEAGARYDRGVAAFVVRPRDTREVSQTVAYCVSRNIRIIPQSGNTGLVGGSTPDASGCEAVLSLDRFSGPLEIDKGNRSVTVGSGVRLSRLNDALAAHGLCYPIDLAADPMMGGMISTNTGGARFIRYGDVRRSVLGLEVVLPDASGTVVDMLSPLRKNNVGVDLKQLFIGTAGAFGVVTRAVLEVARVPRQTASALLVPACDEAVPALLEAIEARAGDCIAAFEGMSGEAISCALDGMPALANPFAGGSVPPYAILLELACVWPESSGSLRLPELLEDILSEIWDAPGGLLSDVLVGRDRNLWALRHALSEGLHHAGKVVAFDLAFRRDGVMAFRRSARQMIGRRFPGLMVCDFGHLGDGGVHFNIVVPPGAPSCSEEELREAVIGLAVEEFGGSFSAEHGIGRFNQTYHDRYTPRAVRDLVDGFRSGIGTSRMGATTL